MDQLDARRRIERWRRTRRPYGRMPEELWEVAVSLAAVDGAYAVARALDLNYATLKRRVQRATGARRAAGAGFVEIDAVQLMGAAGMAGSVVEIAAADGTKLRVQLHPGEALDVVALAGAVLQRGA